MLSKLLHYFLIWIIKQIVLLLVFNLQQLWRRSHEFTNDLEIENRCSVKSQFLISLILKSIERFEE